MKAPFFFLNSSSRDGIKRIAKWLPFRLFLNNAILLSFPVFRYCVFFNIRHLFLCSLSDSLKVIESVSDQNGCDSNKGKGSKMEISCQEKVDDASRGSPVRVSLQLAATVMGRIV